MQSVGKSKNKFVKSGNKYKIYFAVSSRYYLDDKGNPRFAIIDKEDLAFCKEHNWHIRKGKNTFYAIANIKVDGLKNAIALHVALLGRSRLQGFVDDGRVIDHKDQNGLNNSRANLRVATKTENQINSAIPKNNSSGVKGISFNSVLQPASFSIQNRLLFHGMHQRKMLSKLPSHIVLQLRSISAITITIKDHQ